MKKTFVFTLAVIMLCLSMILSSCSCTKKTTDIQNPSGETLPEEDPKFMYVIGTLEDFEVGTIAVRTDAGKLCRFLRQGAVVEQGVENGERVWVSFNGTKELAQGNLKCTVNEIGLIDSVNEEKIYNSLNLMTVEEKIGQLFLAVIDKDKDISSLVSKNQLGGCVLSAEFYQGKSDDEIKNTASLCQTASKLPVFVTAQGKQVSEMTNIGANLFMEVDADVQNKDYSSAAYSDIAFAAGAFPCSGADAQKTAEEIEQNIYPQFSKLISEGADAIILSGDVITNLDAQNKASESAAVCAALREKLAFDGVIISQINASDAVKSFAAGCNMICTNNFEDGIKDLKKALEDGTITEKAICDSVSKILECKYNLNIII